MERDSIVIYHGRCPDGFGAALVCWLTLGERAEYLPYQHDMAAPEVKGKDVYIVDFSFDLTTMERLDQDARSITLLDHHKTAERNLADFQCRCGRVHFNLEKSGASLAWEHFHPGDPLPRLIAHIEDRDLWRWAMPNSAEFLSVIDTLPFEFEKWKPYLDISDLDYMNLVTAGTHMHAKFLSMCRQIAETAVEVEVDGHKGLMVNAGPEFSSDVGNMLAERSGTFGVMWSLEQSGRLKFSLRSVKGFDVEAIAVKFGGGGHTTAAAFRLPASRFPDLVARSISL
jgi:oligoribonuclease NrnB/cAMP/cGMP phosphodiesterase (DHH superfamily)